MSLKCKLDNWESGNTSRKPPTWKTGQTRVGEKQHRKRTMQEVEAYTEKCFIIIFPKKTSCTPGGWELWKQNFSVGRKGVRRRMMAHGMESDFSVGILGFRKQSMSSRSSEKIISKCSRISFSARLRSKSSKSALLVVSSSPRRKFYATLK